MSGRPVDPRRSRIVLVGTPAYRDERLPDIPAVASNIRDLAAALTDPQLGGFDTAHCVTAPEGAGMAEIGELLIQAAGQAEDLLLFYYSGHGLLGPRNHELYLSLAGTRPDQAAFTALPFTAVRDACLDSIAASRVVILDSCFSGRAIGETLSDAAQEILGQVQVAGTYTLTSAPGNKAALVLPGERHTAFTERLLRLLQEGSPQAAEMLSLGDIYRHLNICLRSEGLPAPQQRGTETADLLGLVRNRFKAGRASPAPNMDRQSGRPHPEPASSQPVSRLSARTPSGGYGMTGQGMADRAETGPEGQGGRARALRGPSEWQIITTKGRRATLAEINGYVIESVRTPWKKAYRMISVTGKDPGWPVGHEIHLRNAQTGLDLGIYKVKSGHDGKEAVWELVS